VDQDIEDFSALFGRASESGVRDPEFEAKRRRRRRRRRIVAGSITLVIIAAVATYLPLTLLASAGGATVSVTRPKVVVPAAAVIALPTSGESAVSVAGADAYLGADGLLASSGGNGALPIASISKLITALVILDAKPLGADGVGPTITFAKADVALYDKYYVLDATVSPMKTGSTMSEKDAIATILVASACNYAEAVANWAFGSNAGYVSAVKKWLSAHTLAGTKLFEPTGIDPRNASTPSDLIAIGKLAIANPVVATMVGSQYVSVGTVGTIVNTNSLLGSDGITGIKTGTLASAGSCLLFSGVVDVGTGAPLTIVGIVLGGFSRSSVNSDVRALITSLQSGFHEVSLVKKGDVIGRYTTPWKDDAVVVASDDASVLTWSNTPVTSTVTARALSTGKTGTKVGSLTFAAGTSKVTVPLELKGAIAGPDGWWRVTHPSQLLKK
jgi:D-alanyl-D-alanine carboxypeptidase (penicillin-binding protein 5/6)